jgi:8-oxo-dGTP diphosphatase
MPGSRNKRQLLVVVACILDFSAVESSEGLEKQKVLPRVLLVRRKEAEQKEIHLMWELPGGKVDFGETAEQALVREVQEETGCQVEIVGLIPFSYATEWMYESFTQHTVIYCYECKVRERSEGEAPEDHKIKEVRWFAFDEIDFSRVLPGSREFIWQVGKQHSIDLSGFKPTVAYAYLTHIEPSKNINRFYSIVLQIDPGAEYPYIVTTRRGRLGSEGPGRPMVERFVSDNEARSEILRRLKRRRQHKYLLNDYSDNFPLKDFLETFPEPKESFRQLSLW